MCAFVCQLQLVQLASSFQYACLFYIGIFVLPEKLKYEMKRKENMMNKRITNKK